MSESTKPINESAWWTECSAAATERFGSIPESELDPAGRLLRNALRAPSTLKVVTGSGKPQSSHYQPPLLAIVTD